MLDVLYYCTWIPLKHFSKLLHCVVGKWGTVMLGALCRCPIFLSRSGSGRLGERGACCTVGFIVQPGLESLSMKTPECWAFRSVCGRTILMCVAQACLSNHQPCVSSPGMLQILRFSLPIGRYNHVSTHVLLQILCFCWCSWVDQQSHCFLWFQQVPDIVSLALGLSSTTTNFLQSALVWNNVLLAVSGPAQASCCEWTSTTTILLCSWHALGYVRLAPSQTGPAQQASDVLGCRRPADTDVTVWITTE